MSKPTTLPAWATDDNFDAAGELYDGTPTKVEPTSGRKETGHEPGKKPPAQSLNWWQHLVYLWLTWLTTRTHYEEQWRAAGNGATPQTGWTATIVNASTGVVTAPDSNFRERYLLVALPNAAGIPTYTLTPQYLALLDDDQVIELEQAFRTGALNGAGSNYTLGLQIDNSGGGDEFVAFRVVAGAGNWLAHRADSVGTANVDSGVAVAANTTYRLKIRVEGANVAGIASGTYRVTYFINGVQVSQQTLTPTEAADAVRYYFRSASTNSGTGDQPGVRLGRIALDYGGVA